VRLRVLWLLIRQRARGVVVGRGAMLPSLARLDASVQATVRPSLARRDDAHAREKAPLKVMHPPRRETGARDEAPLLPPNTSRYFYIMHRVADQPFPYPRGARRVLDSGGVRPRFMITEQQMEEKRAMHEYLGIPPPRYYRDDGMRLSIVSFFEELFSPNKGVDSSSFKGKVAWYYLDMYDRRPILSFAHEDELVFRVPEAWLLENVASCLEYMPKMIDENHKIAFGPFAFLTALVVPLKFRITDPTPLVNEERRRMSQVDVRDLVYDAHVRIDPQLRSMAHYVKLHRERAAEEERHLAKERAKPRVFVNPF